MSNTDDPKKKQDQERQRINEEHNRREEDFRENVRRQNEESPTNLDDKSITPDFGRPTMERPSKDEDS